LTVEPADHFVNWQQDAFGNFVARLVFPSRTRSLTITVGLIADMMVVNPFDFFIEEYAEHFPFEYEPELKADLAPYLRPVDDSAQAGIWKSGLPVPPDEGVPTVQFLAGLNSAVHRDVAYDVRMEAGVQTPDETLARAIGWRARCILAAPCCHHDIAAQLRDAQPRLGSAAMLRHGILRERFADVLTDALRAAILRQHGYRVDVVEFVESQHTPRNAMLRARRTEAPPGEELRTELDELTATWQVQPHLAKLLSQG